MGESTKIENQLRLVNGIKTNDAAILRALYTSNYHKIEALVLTNKGTKEHAKDIYQEAFIVLWKNVQMEKFIPQNDTALQGYLYQIAKNKWMDVLRSREFKNTCLINNEFGLDNSSIIDFEDEDELMNENIKRTMEAFKNMGDACKKLLTTFYFEKKSLRLIAEELQIEENTARNKKYRCMQKLRELVLSSKL